jgi:xylanolytic transcriptional activator XlnR
VRERKKRGKASRKDIAAQQAAAAAAAAASSGGTGESGQTSPGNGFSSEEQNTTDGQEPTKNADMPASNMNQSRSQSMSNGQNPLYGGMVSLPRSMSMDGISENGVHQLTPTSETMGPNRIASSAVHDRSVPMEGMTDYNQMDEYHRILHTSNGANGQLQNGTGMMPHSIIPPNNMQNYGENHYQMISPTSQQPPPSAFRMPTGDSPISNFLGSSPVAPSPGWFSLPSPTAGTLYGQPPPPTSGSAHSCRYPVLKPLIPHLTGIIPVSLACDLLEFYFQSSSSTFMQPISPCVLGYIFRKRSFLRQSNARNCSPALLASMIWIGAQTSESPMLTSPPSARGKICQKLLELTIKLLNPLVHSPAGSNEASPSYGSAVVNGVALGGFGVALGGRAAENEAGSPVASGGVDDVATYMHLAVVVSASEYKAASLRWWNAAWSLARELKLSRELAPNPTPQTRPHPEGDDEDAPGEVDVDMTHMPSGHANGTDGTAQGPSAVVSEEEREERRRIWWLLYTMDRHLALCYNRPLFLMDSECEGLLQPVNDTLWQSGDYYNPDAIPSLSDPASPNFRRRGPSFECTGHSIFGFFLPLMTILGEIVDLNHARNHPRFGVRFRNESDWNDQVGEISQQLEAYGRSLENFAARSTANLSESKIDPINGVEINMHEAQSPSNHSVHSSASRSSRIAESILQTKIVVAYGTHIMHTLHILLNGKWDPLSLLDDNDLWISSDSFMAATGHAVSAAEAINDILEHDPDLSFIPFFFGIYLLQGSFLLLLIADKLQADAGQNIVKACETIVRAHEACVVTLNTEYQVRLRQEINLRRKRHVQSRGQYTNHPVYREISAR